MRHKNRDEGAPADSPVDAALLSSLDPEEMAGLERELESLSQLEVPAAARERGWAVVRREIADREARGAFRREQTGRSWSGWRGLVAAAFAFVAIVLAGFGAHSLSVGPVASSNQTVNTMVAQGSSTGSSVAATGGTVSTSHTVTSPPVSRPSSTTETAGVSGASSETNGTTDRTETTGQRPGTSTTPPSTTANTTATTSNTTTTRHYMAKQERADSALGAVNYFAQAVTGSDWLAAQSQVAAGAQWGLTQLKASLTAPSASAINVVQNRDDEDFVRVLLEITDNQVDEQGVSKTVQLRFYIDVRVIDNDPLIVNIYRAP